MPCRFESYQAHFCKSQVVDIQLFGFFFMAKCELVCLVFYRKMLVTTAWFSCNYAMCHNNCLFFLIGMKWCLQVKYRMNKGVCMPFYDGKTNKLVILYFVDCLRMKYVCLYFRKPFAPFYTVKYGISSCDMRHFIVWYASFYFIIYHCWICGVCKDATPPYRNYAKKTRCQ